MKTVALIDYGMGNLDSVARAVEECGATPCLAARPEELEQAAGIILPGVGSYADGMRQLRERGLEAPLCEQALQRGIPLLGICLGMQLLASFGHEGGETPGLDLIPGEVRRFEPKPPGTRIPHVGWNELHWQQDCPLAKDIPTGKDFYFVHSYHFRCDDPAHAVAETPYCGGFTSCIRRDNVFGVQFHPEKSQRFGLLLLRNFLTL